MDVGFLMKKINDLLEKNANRHMQQLDITFTQHHVLVYLAHCPDQKTPLKDLERRMEVAQPTMVGIVHRLEAKGYIWVARDDNDRRIRVVCLTDDGMKICEQSLQYRTQMEENLRQNLNEDELRQLEELLLKIYTGLKEEESKC